MEETEEYMRVNAMMKGIEQQIEKAKDSMKENQKDEERSTKEINDHFARCMEALVTRKATLLSELSLKSKNKRKGLEELQTKLKESHSGCAKLLKEGSLVFSEDSTAAANIWNGINDLPVPQVPLDKISVVVTGALFQTIQTHGKVIVADYTKFAKAEKVSTFAGTMGGCADGCKTQAKFNMPYGICWNLAGDGLFIADCVNNSIRKLTLDGDVTTHIPASKGLAHPCGIAMDHKDGTLYVVNNGNHTISRILPSGEVSVIAGSGKPGYADGVGTAASFSRPWYIARSQQTGDLFVSDSHNHMIRKITPRGEVSTLAGRAQGFADGNAREAQFYCPQGIYFDEIDQSLLVCDNGNNRLRKVLLNGHAFTVCKMPQPTYVTVTANRTIFVSSSQNNLFKVARLGPGNYEATIVAGTGEAKRLDGRPLESSLHNPHGLAAHESTNSLFVSESGSHTVRKISFAEFV